MVKKQKYSYVSWLFGRKLVTLLLIPSNSRELEINQEVKFFSYQPRRKLIKFTHGLYAKADHYYHAQYIAFYYQDFNRFLAKFETIRGGFKIFLRILYYDIANYLEYEEIMRLYPNGFQISSLSKDCDWTDICHFFLWGKQRDLDEFKRFANINSIRGLTNRNLSLGDLYTLKFFLHVGIKPDIEFDGLGYLLKNLGVISELDLEAASLLIAAGSKISEKAIQFESLSARCSRIDYSEENLFAKIKLAIQFIHLYLSNILPGQEDTLIKLFAQKFSYISVTLNNDKVLVLNLYEMYKESKEALQKSLQKSTDLPPLITDLVSAYFSNEMPVQCSSLPALTTIASKPSDEKSSYQPRQEYQAQFDTILKNIEIPRVESDSLLIPFRKMP